MSLKPLRGFRKLFMGHISEYVTSLWFGTGRVGVSFLKPKFVHNTIYVSKTVDLGASVTDHSIPIPHTKEASQDQEKGGVREIQ